MTIVFTVIGRPKSKGRPRARLQNGHVVVYTPPDTQEAERAFRGNARPHAPPRPLEGPLSLMLTFIFRIPKSAKGIEPGDPYEPAPDLDNLAKLVKDSLNGLFWVDDKQVVESSCFKVYGPRDESVVTITTFTKERKP